MKYIYEMLRHNWSKDSSLKNVSRGFLKLIFKEKIFLLYSQTSCIGNWRQSNGKLYFPVYKVAAITVLNLCE